MVRVTPHRRMTLSLCVVQGGRTSLLLGWSRSVHRPSHSWDSYKVWLRPKVLISLVSDFYVTIAFSLWWSWEACGLSCHLSIIEEDDTRLPSCCSLCKSACRRSLTFPLEDFVPHFRHHSAVWLRLFFLADWFFLPKCVLCLCRLWDPFLIDPFLQCFHYLLAFTLKRTCSNSVSRINGMKVSVTCAFPACVHFQVSMVTA